MAGAVVKNSLEGRPVAIPYRNLLSAAPISTLVNQPSAVALELIGKQGEIPKDAVKDNLVVPSGNVFFSTGEFIH
jgi:hypothetical protein